MSENYGAHDDTGSARDAQLHTEARRTGGIRWIDERGALVRLLGSSSTRPVRPPTPLTAPSPVRIADDLLISSDDHGL